MRHSACSETIFEYYIRSKLFWC